MKKPHVLNRPMFNKGGTSAYGRGIASNLVSEEQRQRFNYGGRVRAVEGLDVGGSWSQGLGKDPWGWQTWDPDIFLTPQQIEEKDEEQYATNRERQLGVMDLEDPLEYQGDVIKKAEVIDTKDRGDVMTDSDWMELLGPTPEQTKRTKGKAQLGLAAGALDVFSQPTIAKGMRAASPHLLKLGETATADQAARDKAILQGKVLEKVYKGRETEKGKQARETLETKTDIISASENPRTRYYAGLDAKIGMKKSMEEALGYPIQTIKKDKKTQAPIIPEGTTEETIMWDTESGFMILKDGNLVPITVDKIFALKKK